MSYAIMPMDDYKAVCDKIREKADLINIKFEDTDFGYLRSAVFTIKESGEYTFTIEVKDESKLNMRAAGYSDPEWQSNWSLGIFDSVSGSSATKYFDSSVTLRIFLDNSNGLQPSDIVSATLSYNGEIVEIFADTKKIKSGELVNMVEEVHKAGQLSVIESTEAFKGSVRGNPVVIDDIIHIEHDVDVNVSLKPSFAGLLEGCTFEDTDFGYIRSSPFVAKQEGEHSFALTLADDSKWGDWVIAWENWAADDSPPCSGMNNPSNDEWMYLSEGYTYRLFLGTYKGLKAADILSGTIEIGKNAVAPPVGGSGSVEGVKVSVGGANLLNMDRTAGTLTSGGGNTEKREFEFDKFYTGFARTNYYYPDYATAILQNGVLTVNSKNAYYGVGIPFKVKPNTKYVYRCETTGNPYVTATFYDNDGNYLQVKTGWTLTTPSNASTMLICIVSQVANDTVTASNLQIEYGDTSSPYEPYIEPTEYTTNADGKVEGVKSKYPSMSFSTDTESVNINVNYYRDIDKVINNTAIAVALSGGE